MPNSNNPEEKADEIINFIAASDDLRFSKSKLQIAARGMVDNSNPK